MKHNALAMTHALRSAPDVRALCVNNSKTSIQVPYFRKRDFNVDVFFVNKAFLSTTNDVKISKSTEKCLQS